MADMVSDDELIATGRLPAPLINKFYVSASEVTIRIAFGEQVKPGVTEMRCAVAMTKGDAAMLVGLLQVMIEGGNAPAAGVKAN